MEARKIRMQKDSDKNAVITDIANVFTSRSNNLQPLAHFWLRENIHLYASPELTITIGVTNPAMMCVMPNPTTAP